MTQTHTPGPWEAEGGRVWQRGEFDEPLAYVEHEPDARLMAAAPAMLAVLQGVVNAWGESMADLDGPISGGDAVEWLCNFFPEVTAAIAAATGESAQ